MPFLRLDDAGGRVDQLFGLDRVFGRQGQAGLPELLFGHDQLRRQMGTGRVGLLEGADERTATDRTYQKRRRRGNEQPRPAVAADGPNR